MRRNFCTGAKTISSSRASSYISSSLAQSIRLQKMRRRQIFLLSLTMIRCSSIACCILKHGTLFIVKKPLRLIAHLRLLILVAIKLVNYKGATQALLQDSGERPTQIELHCTSHRTQSPAQRATSQHRP